MGIKVFHTKIFGTRVHTPKEVWHSRVLMPLDSWTPKALGLLVPRVLMPRLMPKKELGFDVKVSCEEVSWRPRDPRAKICFIACEVEVWCPWEPSHLGVLSALKSQPLRTSKIFKGEEDFSHPIKSYGKKRSCLERGDSLRKFHAGENKKEECTIQEGSLQGS